MEILTASSELRYAYRRLFTILQKKKRIIRFVLQFPLGKNMSQLMFPEETAFWVRRVTVFFLVSLGDFYRIASVLH